MDEFIMKEAIFIFLHGPSAYPEGAWEPILLDVLHEVGFNAGALRFVDRLCHSHAVGVGGGRIGCYLESEQVAFGVMVSKGSDDKDRDVAAESWLNEVAMRMVLQRIECIPRVEMSEEKKASVLRESLDLVGFGRQKKKTPWERDSIKFDPKSISEYEAMRQNPPEGFEVFEIFFAQAQVKLLESIERSKALKPILLTEFEDIFVQFDPPGLNGKHLRDEMELQSGFHDVCGGVISFHPTSKTSLTVMCSKCPLNIRLARSTYSTFAQLRDRGERLRAR